LRAGAVQVNVNPLYTPRELEHQLKDSGSETIVIFNGSTPTLAEVAAQAGIKTVITVAPGDGTGAALPSPPVDARLVGSIAFADALREGASMTRTPVALNGDDLIFLQYTGGTTGLSKGAALSHRNLVANVEQFKATMPSAVRPGQEVIVTAIPLYHIFALMVNFLTYFSAGAESWLVANPRDMDGFVETLKQSKPTVFMGVNTLYAGLVMHPKIREVDFSRLHLAGGGGAAVVGAVSDKWKAITGQFIREGYGLSETSPVLSFNPASIQAFSGTTGLPLPGTDIKLLDDAGHEVPLGPVRRGLRQGPAGDARLLEPARGERQPPSPPTAISRPATSACSTKRLPEDRRPQEGHGAGLRLQRLPERGRGRGHRLPGRGRMRLHRRARRQDRRGRQAVRREGARRHP
jgi:long-chain acyl-CoA synthetase